MGYKIREIAIERQFCEQVTADVIEQVMADHQVKEQRKRQLPAHLTVLLCLAMNLMTELSLRFVLIRLVRGTRLLTTLLAPQTYPVQDRIVLYHERWEVAITIDEKRLLDCPFRSLKPVGVIQEWYGLLLAHFVIRSLMHHAAVAPQLDPDRLSFIDSVRLITDAIADFQLIHPEHHPRLWQRLLDDMASCVLPPRDNRINPQVVKRKCPRLRKKRPEHFRPPRPHPFHQSVVISSFAPALN